MKLEDLKPQAGSQHRKRRVGRGIAAGQGASCGVGMRGQKSRSGRPTRPGFEGGQIPLYRRIPKLKHFTVVNRREYTVINIDQLAELVPNSSVSLESLIGLGVITQNDGALKILGRGDISIPLTVHVSAISSGARAKIEAAGGTCVVG
jgi:large subunit ribosomal protein L15